MPPTHAQPDRLRPPLDYASPSFTPGRTAFWGALAAIVFAALCLAARLAREAGWLDALPFARRLAGDPVTTASLGFALLAGVLASIVRIQVDHADADTRRRGRRAFAVLLGLAAALATLSGFILL